MPRVEFAGTALARAPEIACTLQMESMSIEIRKLIPWLCCAQGVNIKRFYSPTRSEHDQSNRRRGEITRGYLAIIDPIRVKQAKW